MMQYWLMKSEPGTFSIDDLQQRPKQIEPWDGVRNYQARNMLRDNMKCGDLAFFYHSNCQPPGIVGIVKIVREGYPDDSAFNPKSQYYDANSSLTKPRWYRVDVQFVEKFERMISLVELKQHESLQDMLILKKGNRLSITPVTAKQWQTIVKLKSAL